MKTGMHIYELLGIVRTLSNQLWVRHWCHFNYPQNPVKMAIQCLDVEMLPDNNGYKFSPRGMPCLEDLGFEVNNGSQNEGDKIYTINRITESGDPYISNL